MTIPADDQPLGRRERRKIETRGRLVAAARELLATQGPDITRINEITERADVGFGSFYNYFESKEAVVTAVVEAVAQELGETIAGVTAELADPAEVLAVAHRAVIEQALGSPSLGWLLVRLELSHHVMSTALGPFALRDLQRGIDAGRFLVPDVAATLVAMGGALLGTVRAALAGDPGTDVAANHVTLMLQLVGLAPDDAAQVAGRPLPLVPTTTTDGDRASA